MNRQALRGLLFVGFVAVGLSAVGEAAQQHSGTMEQLFLQQAAQGQQAEIALGQLAAEKGSNHQVKQFGQRMIQDHQKSSREVQHLATKEGIQISPELTDHAKQIHRRLASLFGKTFDQAYMTYMLRDHVKDVNTFEQNAQMLVDPEIKAWASSTLPILKDHLQRAKAVASAIGMM